MSAPLTSQSAATTSGTATVTLDASRVQWATLFLDVTAAATGVGDTLNVYVQHSPDGGTTWDDFVSFTQVLGNGGAKQYIAHWVADVTPTTPQHAPSDGALAAGVKQGPVGPDWRVKWVIAGGTASFDFSVSANFKRHA